jgi:hypothetical protein
MRYRIHNIKLPIQDEGTGFRKIRGTDTKIKYRIQENANKRNGVSETVKQKQKAVLNYVKILSVKIIPVLMTIRYLNTYEEGAVPN